MAQLTEIQKMMLQKVADMKSVPDQGAFNPVSYTHLDVYKRQPYSRRRQIYRRHGAR